MEQVLKPKHMLLQEFTKTLFEHNPMQIHLSGPDATTEYESEALSILSRFTEGALNLCEDENIQREIAIGVVKQCFEFWFNEPIVKGPESVGLALLEVFKAAFPVAEQAANVEVWSEA